MRRQTYPTHHQHDPIITHPHPLHHRPRTKMVQGPSTTALEALRNASASIDEQIAILRQLKNDIVGHPQRKELVVKQATVEPLVRVASSTGGHGGEEGAEGWSKADEARLQATLVLGSLAAGGAAFMQPLLAAHVPECLLSTPRPAQKTKQLVATLQALRTLAEQSRANIRSDSPARVQVIDHRSLAVFEAVLRGRTPPSHWKQLFHLTADIIIASAVDDETKNDVLESGLWDPLLRLYAQGIYGQDSPPADDGIPFVTTRDLPKVMHAITAIVAGSNYRAESFIQDPAKGADLWNGSHLLAGFPQTMIHAPPPKHVNFNSASPSFPALASLQAGRSGTTFSGVSTDSFSHNIGLTRLMCLHQVAAIRCVPFEAQIPALRLLAAVTHALDSLVASDTSGQDQGRRLAERYAAICAVPIAVRLIQTACEKADSENLSMAEQHAHRELKPEACEALALLIKNSEELQTAAVESGAIKRVCPILKKSFDSVPSTKPMWSRSSNSEDAGSVSASCKLGGRGMPAELDYAMRCRKAALDAVAALGGKNDIHRQAIVQAGAVTCIIDSLKPFPSEVLDKMDINGHQISPKDGNTTTVILAACRAAQAMSRSVSLLRTSLIDAGIAKPMFDSLKHPMLEVRIAATEVCCNLLLDFSPMREDLLEAGAVKTLTEQARQSEMALRLSSLWALKHLVLNASKEIRIQALEELGVGWLIAAIQGEHQVEMADANGGGVAINPVGGLSAPNAAGERVDLLNPSSMDVDDPPANSHGFDEEEDGEVLYDEASSTHYRASNLRSTLSAMTADDRAAKLQREWPVKSRQYLDTLRDVEQNADLRARRDDVAVQEQGLDFIRNLLNGDDCALMFEHLLHQAGAKQLFALMTEKLAPLNPQPSSQSSRNSASASRPIYHPTELILSTVHVLTHMANGSPAQKQLLVAQKPLLQAWVPHFNHADRRVRCVSVWAINSICWVEDEGDRLAARERLSVLRSVGLVAAVEGLRGDVDLDVRERVRVAGRGFEVLS